MNSKLKEKNAGERKKTKKFRSNITLYPPYENKSRSAVERLLGKEDRACCNIEDIDLLEIPSHLAAKPRQKNTTAANTTAIISPQKTVEKNSTQIRNKGTRSSSRIAAKKQVQHLDDTDFCNVNSNAKKGTIQPAGITNNKNTIASKNKLIGNQLRMESVDISNESNDDMEGHKSKTPDSCDHNNRQLSKIQENTPRKKIELSHKTVIPQTGSNLSRINEKNTSTIMSNQEKYKHYEDIELIKFLKTKLLSGKLQNINTELFWKSSPLSRSWKSQLSRYKELQKSNDLMSYVKESENVLRQLGLPFTTESQQLRLSPCYLGSVPEDVTDLINSQNSPVTVSQNNSDDEWDETVYCDRSEHNQHTGPSSIAGTEMTNLEELLINRKKMTERIPQKQHISNPAQSSNITARDLLFFQKSDLSTSNKNLTAESCQSEISSKSDCIEMNQNETIPETSDDETFLQDDGITQISIEQISGSKSNIPVSISDNIKLVDNNKPKANEGILPKNISNIVENTVASGSKASNYPQENESNNTMKLFSQWLSHCFNTLQQSGVSFPPLPTQLNNNNIPCPVVSEINSNKIISAPDQNNIKQTIKDNIAPPQMNLMPSTISMQQVHSSENITASENAKAQSDKNTISSTKNIIYVKKLKKRKKTLSCNQEKPRKRRGCLQNKWIVTDISVEDLAEPLRNDTPNITSPS